MIKVLAVLGFLFLTLTTVVAKTDDISDLVTRTISDKRIAIADQYKALWKRAWHVLTRIPDNEANKDIRNQVESIKAHVFVREQFLREGKETDLVGAEDFLEEMDASIARFEDRFLPKDKHEETEATTPPEVPDLPHFVEGTCDEGWKWSEPDQSCLEVAAGEEGEKE